MEFIRFCPDGPNPEFEKALNTQASRLNSTITQASELPDNIEMHQVLCVCFKSLELKYLRPLTHKTYQYLAFIEGYQCPKVPVILRTGGNFFQRDDLKKDSEFITKNLCAVIENMKLKDLAYHLTLKELTLMRRIYGLVEADKKMLAEEIYGAVSETTLDVNLARLRKKLADPKAGEDFFRIVTKKRKLYLVSALKNFDENEFIDVFK